jgi:RAD50-interacting protein 1
MHADFMNTEIQSILNEIGLRRSALSEFITALLPILQRKIDHVVPDLLKNAPLLSHFMHENLVFDVTLRERYLYLPAGKDKWNGLIQHSLKSARVFATWRDVEKDCTDHPVMLYGRLMVVAMSRYNDILSEADASEIEYEGVDAFEVRPTKGAMRVMDLLETFTGFPLSRLMRAPNCRSIPQFGSV